MNNQTIPTDSALTHNQDTATQNELTELPQGLHRKLRAGDRYYKLTASGHYRKVIKILRIVREAACECQESDEDEDEAGAATVHQGGVARSQSQSQTQAMQQGS